MRSSGATCLSMDGFPLLKPTEVVEPVKYFIFISSITETCSCHDFDEALLAWR
jgi:hypothetical protein